MLKHLFKETPITTEFLLERLKNHFLSENLELLKQACSFAKDHYANLAHPTGKSYIQYVFEVALMLDELRADITVITAAIISPPLFVQQKVLDDLKLKFTEEIQELVKELIRLGRLEWSDWSIASEQGEFNEQDILQKMFYLAITEAKNKDQAEDSTMMIRFQKKEKQIENLIRMFLTTTTNIHAHMIKLVDRLHFMELLKDLPQNHQESTRCALLANITLAIHAPIADRLGMWRLKSELEDMSFRLLEPDKYKEIAKQLAAKKEERRQYVDDVITFVREKLETSSIKAEISGRAKHIYSIYQKMDAKQLTLDEINDLLGIRIIVDTSEDCYNVQSILHEYWPPLTAFYDGKAGRDWIANPKLNLYQSLHTTILIENRAVEIQIRTHTMHTVAEYGVAAAQDAVHWRYKESKAYRKVKTLGDAEVKDRSRQLADLRMILAKEQNSSFSTPKDMLKDWIFVITPQGHIIDLPAGATPLDFAYRIHTELGHRCIGARVGGKYVRLDYELKNGEVVEIIASRAGKGPSSEWLSISRDEENKDKYMYARTHQARDKIRHWFKMQRPNTQS